jgi:peptidoglycan/LPS O-acetylase OafA/YrhL
MNGAAGVDIFFVISGFVMMTSTSGLAKYRHPVLVFLERRITRIVPLYWLATAFKIALLVFTPALTIHQRLTLANSLGSFLFVPVRNANHEVLPVVIVGWTLNFEMFFYAVFALAILFRRRLIFVLTVVLTCLSIVSAFYRESWPAITTLANPMLLEFLFGVMIARAAIAKRLPGVIASCAFLATGFLVILTAYPHLPLVTWQAPWRFLMWGIPAAAIVLGAVGLEDRIGIRIPHWLVSLGDASYAIYLVQTFVLPLVGIAVVHLSLHRHTALAACILLGGLLSALAGEITHRYVELPVLTFLKSRQGNRLVYPAGGKQ